MGRIYTESEIHTRDIGSVRSMEFIFTWHPLVVIFLELSMTVMC